MGDEQSLKGDTRWAEGDVRSLVREIISDLSPTHSEPVPQARLVEDLNYNSLSLLELAFSLEDEFELPTIDEATARQILTVDDVEQHVLTQLRSAQQIM